MTKDIKTSNLTTTTALSPPSSPIGSPLAPAQIPPLPNSMSAASDLINKSHRRTAASIMETAYYCYEAQKRWKRKIKEFIHLLDFDQTQFSRYYKAYEREVLRAHVASLPPSLKTWSTLRKLSDPDLEKCFAQGKIKPSTTDKDARALVREHVPLNERKSSNLRRVETSSISPANHETNVDEELISITVMQENAENNMLSFKEWLNEGRQKFGINVQNWNFSRMYDDVPRSNNEEGAE